jgi:hypothetical protein
MFAIVHVVRMAHMVHENELGQPPTLANINVDLLKQKGLPNLGLQHNLKVLLLLL